MNTLEIKSKLEQEIDKLLDIGYSQNDLAIFLNNFLENNNFKGIYNIENINISDFFVAYMLYQCNDLDYHQLKEIANESEIFKENISQLNFDETVDKIYHIATTKLCYNRNRVANNIFNTVLDIDLKKDDGLIELMHQHLEETLTTLSLISSILGLKKHNKVVELFSDVASVSKQLKRFNKKKTDTSEFDSLMEGFIDYCNSVVTEEKKKKKKVKKDLVFYQKLISWLNKVEDKHDQIDISQEILKIPNNEILTTVLKEIYKHNLFLCEEKKEEYEKLLKDSKKHYKRILKKHNLNVDDKDLNFLIDIDEFDSCLTLLEKLNINDDTTVKILQKTSKGKIEKLMNFVNCGYIKKELLVNFPNLFYNDNTDFYDSLCNNIDLLKSKKVSARVINNMDYVVFYPSLEKSISLLEDYDYLSALKKSSSYEFLISNNLEQKLNIMVELGYGDNLEENLSLLKFPTDKYKNLFILREMNLLPEDTETLLNVLDKNLINDKDSFDNYLLDMGKYIDLEDNAKTIDEFLEHLDFNNSQKSDLKCYHFGNTLISKIKVKRELSKIDRDTITSLEQFKVLTKDKILNNSEYSDIVGILTNNSKDSSKNLVK